MFASIVAISIGTNMKADAQNPTTSEEAASQMTNMTNMTGLSSSTGAAAGGAAAAAAAASN